MFGRNTMCSVCRGKGMCGMPCPIVSKFMSMTPKDEFSGSTPPSVFVGRFGYPDVFAGILSPSSNDAENASILDSPETWYSSKCSIGEILGFRSQMIYSRFRSNVRARSQKLLDVQQEVACAEKPCDIEVVLEKKPSLQISFDSYSAPVANPAMLKDVRISNNPCIPAAVERIVSDTDMDASCAVDSLYKKGIFVSSIQKIFSTGMLGVKMQRKLVPTRWSVTAVDDIVSMRLIEDIKGFQQLGEFMLFSNTYLGNHYEILLIPRHWSFELIEMKFPGSVWNPSGRNIAFFSDYEGFYPRKKYASNTVGGYYASRLAVCEYLSGIRRQATAFVLRECMPEYFAPLGVWVCRETCRHAFDRNPEKFSSLSDALSEMQKRMRVNWNSVTDSSELLGEIENQKSIKDFT